MSWLVDTNVLSEAVKPRPAARVLQWLGQHEPDLYVSALTIGELEFGIARLPRGKRRESLQRWLSKTCEIMEGRVLSVNASVAHVWGQLRATWSASGVSMPSIDGLIAATAKRHGLVIVTRNEPDFARCGVRTVNPFAS